MTKALKQNFGDKKCTAVVCAMATMSSVEEFEDFMQQVQIAYPFIDTLAPWGHRETNLYLMLFGLRLEKEYLFKINEDSRKPKFNIDLVLEPKRPAFLTVKSENNPKRFHAIYWDGHQIYDPNPKVENKRPLADYKISRWATIKTV